MGGDEWHDPHDIIPEEFREEFGDSETVADALRRVEARPSTTSLGERPRCPECNTTHVSAKASKMGRWGNGRDGGFRCGNSDCMAHFEEPVYNTAIPMNDARTLTFSWIDTDELADPDTRGEGPLFASLDEETRIGLAIVLYRPWTDGGPSLRELAPLFPHTRYWVGERNREWKTGEHRDLVADPTPDAEPDAAPGDEPPLDPAVAVARIGGDYDELVAERADSTDASTDATAVATDGGRRRRWAAYGSD